MRIWDGIPEFLAVVETGSFSAAARQMGLSTSYISRRVASLEARLDIRLLARSTRRVCATGAGAEYYKRCKALTAGLIEANQVMIRESTQVVGSLKVSATGAFAERCIAPALAEFAAQHPKVNIEIEFSSREINLVEEGFDFAIRYGVLEDSNLVALKLRKREMVVCASPDYLSRSGLPIDPAELSDHDCLRMNHDRWRFQYPDGPRYIRISGPWISNNGPALESAAIAGLGILYSPRVNVENGLESGRLVTLLEDFWDSECAAWIVYPSRHHLPLRVQRAIEFLVDRFKSEDIVSAT